MVGGDAFVGRARELAQLHLLLDRARAGNGQVVLLAGEPGIGKTRLASELARHADGLGVLVGSGRASEDDGPPYWIFRQLFTSLGRSLPDAMTGTAGGEDQERFAFFQAVTEQLRAAGDPSGLVVFFDDLQWADAASLGLFKHLVRGIGPSRLMLVAAYRDTETVGRAALAATLSALAAEPALTRIRLVGLTPAEVERQLVAIATGPVSESQAALVSRRSGGNPFFVAELGRLLDTADDALPDAVLDAVRARLGRLSSDCQVLVATAAALDDTLDPATLCRVMNRPLAEVLGSLDEAAAAGIVIAEGRRWRFGHDLIRESARLTLSTAARLGAHAKLAALLQDGPAASAHAAEIAHHWLESLPIGDAARASVWAERAADDALAQLAWERAAELYRRARDTGAPLTAVDRSRLLRCEAVAYLRAGNVSAASTELLAAGDAAREAGDAAALGEVALVVEGVADPWESFRGGPVAAEALAGLPPYDTPLRARLLSVVAGEACFDGGPEPDRLSAEALAMAERLGDRGALRSALRARQMVRSSPDGVHERLQLARRMLDLGIADRDPDTMLWGHLWRFDALAMLGRLDEAEAELTPIRTLAGHLRRPIARWHELRSSAAIHVSRGRFDEAVAAIEEGLALIESRANVHASLRGVPITVLTAIGGLTGREHLLNDMLELFDRGAPAFVSVMFAKYWLKIGDPETARRMYAKASGPETIPVPAWLSGAAAYVEMAEFGPPQYVHAAAAKLRPYADLFVTGGGGVLLVLGSVHSYLGMAAAATGHLDDAVRELRRGVEANDRAGTPPFAALARYELAKVLARRCRPGDTDEALALAASVTDTANRLGMAPLRREAADLAAKLRGEVPGPLTPREREVAGHVAQGLTNKQVAALMRISERTAESHVQHILAKLRLANRTQIAAWVASEKVRTPRS